MIRIGLYGSNGHQIHDRIAGHPLCRLVATAVFPREKLPASLAEDLAISHHASLDDLLADTRVDLISLCSPRRRNQGQDALRALRAGKHVYAEKPGAMSEAELDAIVRTCRETGLVYREMAGTAFTWPYFEMRRIVLDGQIGEIVQITAEKSYPYHDGRPQDEEVDGGLIGQNAIHGLRFVEHVAGVHIAAIQALETTLGNPVEGGGLRMASTLIAKLENGGIASISANYLNPRGTGVWGNDTLRIWGTKGMIESTEGGNQTRLVIGEKDLGPLSSPSQPAPDYFELLLEFLSNGTPMPLTLEEELLPTRWALRARASLH